MSDQTFSSAAAVEPLTLDQVQRAFGALPKAPPPVHGYITAGSASSAVEAVIAMAKKLGELSIGESELPREGDILALWRTSGLVAYLHPGTLSLFITAVTFDSWMSREERP